LALKTLLNGDAVKLADYLENTKRGDPPVGTVGVESDWLEVGSFEVTTGSLWAGDPYVCNAEDGYVVKVPAGSYLVQAKAMDFAGRKLVSRMRVVHHAAGNPALGKEVGETGTDTAMIAVCDIEALVAAVAGDHDRFLELVTGHDYKECGIVEFKLKKVVSMPYVTTGSDGGWPVFELRAGRRRVGIELEFMPPGFAFRDENDDFVWDPEEVECGHCGGSGKCFCLRKGAGTAAGCVRCGGSGKCRACGGKGKCWR
jgi:hypothetical protein